MVVVTVLLFLVYSVNCNSIILPKTEEKTAVIKGVVDIIQKYYKDEKGVTYVNLHANDDGILMALNQSPTISIISRTPFEKVYTLHEGYLINAKDPQEFLSHFDYLVEEPDWNPSVRFIIVIENLCHIEKIFNLLLKFHVINVLVINATNQADVYTYNPFENFGCGRYFNRVISFGLCASARIHDLFPNKLQNGLRNCTINMAVSHLPPLTYKQNLCHSKNKEFCIGTEQYAFQLISELEHFNVNYSYYDFAQEFSGIDLDMKAVGSFSFIQKNQSDGLFGFTILSNIRAKAFSNVYKHMAYTDEWIFIVKKSGYVPVWKNVYLEFESTVWIMIFSAFFISAALIIYLSKSKDKSAVLLKMWDTFFLHGNFVHHKCILRFFLIVWIWFAFLINSFYQSSLMSLTTNPSKDFQIANEGQLRRAGIKPCVSWAIAEFFMTFAEFALEYNEQDCREIISSLKKVSKSYELYTILPHHVFKYNAPLFSSDGEELYHFKRPIMKVIYALYFYKGFPWIDKFEKRALQLRDFGLIDKHTETIHYYNKLKYQDDSERVFKAREVVPWGLLLIGTVIATFVFILEVVGRNIDTENN